MQLIIKDNNPRPLNAYYTKSYYAQLNDGSKYSYTIFVELTQKRRMKNSPVELIEDLKIIRTIHSNRAKAYGIFNFWYTIFTVLIAVIITFIGFSGADNFAKLINSNKKMTNNAKQNESKRYKFITLNDTIKSKELDTIAIFVSEEDYDYETTNFNFRVKMIMDLMTLSILVISILGLILRFERKMTKHNIAVLKLSEFISDLAFNYSTIHATPQNFQPNEITIYNEKYKSLISNLPPTTDNDYFYALKTIQRKNKIKAFIESADYPRMNLIKRSWTLLWI